MVFNSTGPLNLKCTCKTGDWFARLKGAHEVPLFRVYVFRRKLGLTFAREQPLIAAVKGPFGEFTIKLT